ncbi:MAG TPA: hypothetical protein VMP68_00630 [Candidatus Eisenbacteria bacterium]|nr:hypothetical protein [Candidatus Eisenbacteria bacterium]
MSSSTSTAWKGHKLILALALGLLGSFALAQDVTLQVPAGLIAGNAATIGTNGSGSATFYLVGPAASIKREVELGREISLAAKDLQAAGRYVAVVCSSNCTSQVFFVAPGKPVDLSFIVHPSRAPVAENEAISGVALTFDEFRNLVVTPSTVQFQWSTKGSNPMSRSSQTREGIAWFRTSSGKTAGPLQISAAIGNDVSTRRVVQQVASIPCNLRIKGQRTAKGILVETEPIRDCSGNPVPDGTVVTFTARDGAKMSTVDAPVKQDVARATILAKGPVTISAASGVAMGNELRLSGKE